MQYFFNDFCKKVLKNLEESKIFHTFALAKKMIGHCSTKSLFLMVR